MLEGSMLESREVNGDCSFDLMGYKAGVYMVTKQTALQTLTAKLIIY
jgi:hypothetical protein